MRKYTCPEGHSEGLQQCFRIYIFAPLDATKGEVDLDNIALGDCEEDHGEWEALQYYCPTCNDCFDSLKENSDDENRNHA